MYDCFSVVHFKISKVAKTPEIQVTVEIYFMMLFYVLWAGILYFNLVVLDELRVACHCSNRFIIDGLIL